MQKSPKILFLILLGLIYPLDFWAQDNAEIARQLVEIADEAYEVQRAVDLAKEQYVMAVQTDPTNIRANWMAGQTYLESVNRDRATEYFLNVLEMDPDYRFDLLYNIGWGFQLGLEFDKALQYLEQYKQKLQAQPDYRGRDKVPLELVERRILECNTGKELVGNPLNFSIQNLGSFVNSEWPDYAPVLNEDETLLIFTTRRKEGNLNEDVFEDNFPYEDIFISRKVNEQWGRAENMGQVINTPFFDSNLGLSPDASKLYIYKDNNGGDIYYSELQSGGTYSSPEPLGEQINSSFTEKSVSVSPNETLLFFSSDRPGGFGGLDIYLSQLQDDGTWGPSQNLGEDINTEYDEDGPFVDWDGKTLYFSSKGGKGMGGFDIFKTIYDKSTNSWSEIQNVGYPINTPDNDIFFVSTKDGKRGYYASVREDGLGYDDIYMITVPDLSERAQLEVEVVQQPEEPAAEIIPVILTVKVQEAGSSRPLDARVGARTRGGGTIVNSSKGGTGQYTFSMNFVEATAITLSVELSGYAFQNLNLEIPAASSSARNLNRTISLKKLVVGTRSVLRNIYFDFDKIRFGDASYTELNKLENMMAQNSSINLEISGHTDNVGTEEYNMQLSQRRAGAVVDYLVGKGIDSRRVRAVGYGRGKPLASNDDEQEGREINRRVEFKVTQ